MSNITRAPRTAPPLASTTSPRNDPRDCAIAKRDTDKLRTRIADDLNSNFIFYSLLSVLSGANQFPFDSVAGLGEVISRPGPGHRAVDIINQIASIVRANAVDFYDQFSELT